MDEHHLTFEEEVYYANYGMCEDCDLCGVLRGYINYHEGSNYIEICENGTQFLCQNCIR